MAELFPRCPRCGEPAREVIMTARVVCSLTADGEAGPVVHVGRKVGVREYRCGGRHVFTVAALDARGATLDDGAQGRASRVLDLGDVTVERRAVDGAPGVLELVAWVDRKWSLMASRSALDAQVGETHEDYLRSRVLQDVRGNLDDHARLRDAVAEWARLHPNPAFINRTDYGKASHTLYALVRELGLVDS